MTQGCEGREVKLPNEGHTRQERRVFEQVDASMCHFRPSSAQFVSWHGFRRVKKGVFSF